MDEVNYDEPIYSSPFGEGKGAGGVVTVTIDGQNDTVLIGASDSLTGDFLVGSLSALEEVLSKGGSN